MPGKFEWQPFSKVNLSDVFFDTLKFDYPEFPQWFQKKADNNENALVFHDEQGVGAFVYLKRENEEIELESQTLPAVSRLKIGTLKLADRYQNQRLGEGALGVSLWYWRDIEAEDVYVTVFEKHSELIRLFGHFGFLLVGKNKRGECVYLKSRNNLDYSDPYKPFPFISPNFEKAGIIPINDHFHDKLFPYSELKGNNNEIIEETAGNGITKVYIATPSTFMNYGVGEPIFIYRIHTGVGQKTYKSAVTSYGTITKIDVVKNGGVVKISLDEFVKNAGNKTVFTAEELTATFNQSKNIVMLELVYNGYFGKGKNVNHRKLDDSGLFTTYPYNIEYSSEQFKRILEMGDKNVQNVIVD